MADKMIFTNIMVVLLIAFLYQTEAAARLQKRDVGSGNSGAGSSGAGLGGAGGNSGVLPGGSSVPGSLNPGTVPISSDEPIVQESVDILKAALQVEILNLDLLDILAVLNATLTISKNTNTVPPSFSFVVSFEALLKIKLLLLDLVNLQCYVQVKFDTSNPTGALLNSPPCPQIAQLLGINLVPNNAGLPSAGGLPAA